MVASEPKCVNPILNIIRVNSLRHGDLHIYVILSLTSEKDIFIDILPNFILEVFNFSLYNQNNKQLYHILVHIYQCFLRKNYKLTFIKYI